MASQPTLPASALQASKAALAAALAENPMKELGSTQNGESISATEPGEIQEIDMQAQAENIRTVFSDAKNFNVKVRFLPTDDASPMFLVRDNILSQFLFSTHYTLHGPSGSTPLLQRAVIYLRHPCLPSLKHRCLRHLVGSHPRHKVGWKISNVSSALTA